MAHIRIPDGLKEKVQQEVNDNPDYDSQKEFVSDAIRRLLDNNFKSTEEIVEKVKEDIRNGEVTD